jgi:hypothetical protein
MDKLSSSLGDVLTKKLVSLWEELVAIVQGLILSDGEDQMVWKISDSGVYSSQSLYAVLNFRGITHVFLPAVWKLNIPPRVQVFLWLVSHNKILTRDNLAKRQHVNDPSCLFCGEIETMEHLCFSCDVTRLIWRNVSDIVKTNVGISYENVARLWISNKKNCAINMITSVIMWNLWKM